MTDNLAYFNSMYANGADPYALRTRWYERRKRDILLASLPKARYISAFEPGCGNGELTTMLAQRCDQLLASDFAEVAVQAARGRTGGQLNVRVARQILPQAWPHNEGPFDLIVLSEVGYFLEAAALRQLADACAASLAGDGTLVACDWRAAFPERALSTAEVHETLAGLGIPQTVAHEEYDFSLRVWCRDGLSVARREGIP